MSRPRAPRRQSGPCRASSTGSRRGSSLLRLAWGQCLRPRGRASTVEPSSRLRSQTDRPHTEHSRMNCPSCGAPNEATRKFCGQCGRGLAIACAGCGTPNAPGTKFCGECGTALAPPVAEAHASDANGAAGGPAVEVLARSTSERRLVSVMFADLVGFTTLVE